MKNKSIFNGLALILNVSAYHPTPVGVPLVVRVPQVGNPCPRAYKDGNSFISVNQILQLANGECLRLFFLLLANQVN
jgi:hypothetical protein